MTNQTDKNSNAIRAVAQSKIERLPASTNPSAATPMPTLDSTRRRANRQLTTEQLLQLLENEAPQLLELARVVGKWVWIEFSERPACQVTAALSEFGFRWNKARHLWQHPCGEFVGKPANYDPREKYGNRPAVQVGNGGQDND